MISIYKALLIGFIVTILRIIGQFLIPEVEQNVLQPSIFVKQNTLPIIFSLYAFFGFSTIAYMFVLVEKSMYGKKIVKGLKYGLAFCTIWVVYLFEPLKHSDNAGFMDSISYPVVDGISLIILGMLSGFFLTKDNVLTENPNNRFISRELLKFQLIIAMYFITGRIFLYTVVGIYSQFNTRPLKTIIWMVITGFTVAVVLSWFSRVVESKSRLIKALIIGGVLFGINLIIFNFFIPLVFDFNLLDLLARTFIDIIFITLGVFFLPLKNKAIKS